MIRINSMVKWGSGINPLPHIRFRGNLFLVIFIYLIYKSLTEILTHSKYMQFLWMVLLAFSGLDYIHWTYENISFFTLSMVNGKEVYEGQVPN